jgi:prevent-host-death family protein
MNVWPVQEAKSRFSELLEACVNEGPQLVTRRGADTAVLIHISEWKRLNNAARPSLKSLLLSNIGRGDFELPPRGGAKLYNRPLRRKMYLHDTNVVSELRKIRPHGAVVAWLENVADEDIHLSSHTVNALRLLG